MEHLNSLERNLAIIGTIAVIAPFVGLFGTVSVSSGPSKTSHSKATRRRPSSRPAFPKR